MLCWITIFGGVLIMMGQHSRSEALFYYFRLDDQVPENHLLRLIEKHISFAFVQEKLKDSYSQTGRPSTDPELLLRILLIGGGAGGGSSSTTTPLPSTPDFSLSVSPSTLNVAPGSSGVIPRNTARRLRRARNSTPPRGTFIASATPLPPAGSARGSTCAPCKSG